MLRDTAHLGVVMEVEDLGEEATEEVVWEGGVREAGE